MRRAIVMIEQPAESPATANPRDSFDLWREIDEFVVESLVIPLPVVVRDVLRNRPAKMVFAERDHSVQALMFDGAHKRSWQSSHRQVPRAVAGAPRRCGYRKVDPR